MLELKETVHSYYCSDNNYYVDGYSNHGRCDYDSWENFKSEWLGLSGDILGLDDDYNHVFRFDLLEKRDEETDKPLGRFELWIFFMLQRKGIFAPVWIKEIKQEDMTEIEEFLRDRWEYMKNQWREFSI